MITSQTNLSLRRKFKYRCLINPSHVGTDLHHIVPRSQGGSDDDENKVFLCRKCHAMIHSEGAVNWQEKLIELRKLWFERYVND